MCWQLHRFFCLNTLQKQTTKYTLTCLDSFSQCYFCNLLLIVYSSILITVNCDDSVLTCRPHIYTKNILSLSTQIFIYFINKKNLFLKLQETCHSTGQRENWRFKYKHLQFYLFVNKFLNKKKRKIESTNYFENLQMIKSVVS